MRLLLGVELWGQESVIDVMRGLSVVWIRSGRFSGLEYHPYAVLCHVTEQCDEPRVLNAIRLIPSCMNYGETRTVFWFENVNGIDHS